MRRPSLEKNEDDLSRLTVVVSPTTVSLSSTQTDAGDVDGDGTIASKVLERNLNGVLPQQHYGTTKCGNSITSSNSTSLGEFSLPEVVVACSDRKKSSSSNSSNNNSDQCHSRNDPACTGTEWQGPGSCCRKRKERQDSTSSISQDRKLIRSNSEEHLSPNTQEEIAVRRVASHEDFKKPSPLINEGFNVNKENIIEESAENEEQKQLEEKKQLEVEQQIFEKNLKNSSENLKKFFIGSESLCASNRNSVESQTSSKSGDTQHHHHHHHHGNHLSHHHSHHHHFYSKSRLSPCRDVMLKGGAGSAGGIHRKDSDSDLDGEHERRRHCERFSKTRPPPGRKSVSPRSRSGGSNKHHSHGSSGKYIQPPGKTGGTGNEHFYSKHDSHHAVKHERRSAASSFGSKRDKAPASAMIIDSTMKAEPTIDCASSGNEKDVDNNNISDSNSKPWGPSFQDEETPVVCQRFADHKFEHANKMGTSFGEIRSLPPNATMKHHYGAAAAYRSAEHPSAGSVVGAANHQKVAIGAALSSSSATGAIFDERIRVINRKLSALKKKLTQYEDRFEAENGYRPAHGDKTGDNSIRATVVEIHKLRKEKNQIKAELVVFNAKMAAKAAKTIDEDGDARGEGGQSLTVESNKLTKMKDTIADIEKRLQEKRDTDHRSNNLESMSSDQLVEEKATVQRALLYLESIYGRPSSRDERDAARPLYDRYRIIKRMVNRANSISGPCGVNAQQMPTILEHEALAIVGTPTPSTTDITPPSANSTVQSPITDGGGSSSTTSAASSSTTTTTTASAVAPAADESEPTTTSSSITENIHSMSAEELWEHYDAAREEKKELRRTIKDFEQQFEATTGRKMLKSDRKQFEETYTLYKQKKAKLRLIDALFKKQMSV